MKRLTDIFGDDSSEDNWADALRKMVLDEENNALYLVGEYCPPEDTAHPQLCLVKMNLDGEMIYFNTYGGCARGNDIIMGNDGYIYISGATGSDLILAKIYPENGIASWISIFESTGMNGGGMGICQGSDGSIYQGGTLDHKWAVLRYNSYGNLLWYTQYESAHSDGDWFPVARFVDFYDGKIYASGTVDDVNNNDICLKCYNTNGVELWSNTFDGGYGFDMCEGMVRDSDGNFILAGHSAISDTASKELVLKYSSDGEQLWTYSNNVGGLEEGVLGVDVDSADDIYIGGYRQVPDYQYPDDYLTQKISGNDGTVLWEFTLDRDNTTDEGWAIAVYDIDDVFVTGRSHTWNTWYDVLTVNYKTQTSVEENQVPTADIHLKNYPNPFRTSTTISYEVRNEQNEPKTISIYNIKGQKIRTLECINNVNAKATKSLSYINWDGTDKNEKPVSPGIYLLKMKIDNRIFSKKMLMIR